jgi:hypothetical protein
LEGDHARIIGSIVNFRMPLIISGSKWTIRAVIIPATAPIAAANPQPKANIRPTRMPTSRLDTEFRDAALIASGGRGILSYHALDDRHEGGAKPSAMSLKPAVH